MTLFKKRNFSVFSRAKSLHLGSNFSFFFLRKGSKFQSLIFLLDSVVNICLVLGNCDDENQKPLE